MTVTVTDVVDLGHAIDEIVTEVIAPDWPSFVRKSALRADSFPARLLTRSSIREWPPFVLIAPTSIRLRL